MDVPTIFREKLIEMGMQPNVHINLVFLFAGRGETEKLFITGLVNNGYIVDRVYLADRVGYYNDAVEDEVRQDFLTIPGGEQREIFFYNDIIYTQIDWLENTFCFGFNPQMVVRSMTAANANINNDKFNIMQDAIDRDLSIQFHLSELQSEDRNASEDSIDVFLWKWLNVGHKPPILFIRTTDQPIAFLLRQCGNNEKCVRLIFTQLGYAGGKKSKSRKRVSRKRTYRKRASRKYK